MSGTRHALLVLSAAALAAATLDARAASVSAPMGNAVAQRGPFASHAQVALLAESTTLPDSRSEWLGLRFTIDEGWHIYWRNPGESGGPPEVRWQTPKGITVGALQWPVPARMVVLGVTNYGYERGAVLLAPVHREVGEGTGADILIGATVEYVICREICIKESATPSLTLRAQPGGAAALSSAVEIGRAKARLPKTAPATWRASAAIGGNTVILTVQTGTSETNASLFPFTPGVIDDGAPQEARASARGVTLRLKKSPFFLKAPAALEGVLVLPGARAYVISAPFGS